MVTAGIYARPSSDSEGTRLGVERQITDCEALAERLGWTVAGVYADDDASAWSEENHPEYRRMLDDLEKRVIDGILAWHPDRLTHHLGELEELIALVDDIGDVPIETVTAGGLDLSTSAGRSAARIVGAIARQGSDDASDRLRRSGRWRLI
jgi:DNA invertase Pin-like site-specific DNA recombinase